MKPILYTLLMILLCNIISCSCKQTVSNTTPASIAGKWKWVETYFDYAPSDSNPLTPAYNGIQEFIYYNTDATWKKIQNNKTVDSGTYSTGHGSYLPYAGAYDYIYDSVKYYHSITGANWDYYTITNDTLLFSGGFAGIIGSGSKIYIRQ